ncbi:Helicase SWR1 [Trametes pubescens]|uniref:DNA helicase n=1 Tax=Trametes pubescens TaxID=154538 RepID=A0A1M2VK13_TRAPU|nr:Helicase SWR1 [Trametes pubescens]
MSTRRKFQHSEAPATSSAPSGKPTATESGDGGEGVIEDVRAQWVQERREELDRVFDTHDTLIREAFHLEKFVSLLTYDPKVAKEDRSDVFQRYQAQYDLVNHNASAGPSRRTTRRAHTERLQTLKVPALAAPSPTQKKARRTEEKPSVAFWDLKAEAKHKGKQMHVDSQNTTASPASPPRKGKGKQPVVEILVRRPPVRRPKSPALATHSDHEPEVANTSHAPANGLAPPPPRKKRRLTHHASTADLPGRTSTRQSLRSAASVPDLSSAASYDAQDALPLGAVNGASSMGPPAEPPPSPTKLPIPRIKLIVRKPAPVYTHPLQRPTPTPFGGSIEALLNSFTFRLHDEVTAEQLDEEVEAELKVWRHVDKLRKEGRMIGERSSFEYKPAEANDAWAHIVREIERPGAKLVNTRRGAVNVASKMKGHWTGESDRERKRLRVLARRTLEMVIEEWKKAVYHIREQERLEREEEERKLGQQHLDAILDQSGQILETQLLDLARDGEHGSRSRSRSVSTPGADWHAMSGDDGSDATEVSEDENASESSDVSDTPGLDEGISMLLTEDALAGLVAQSPRGSSMETGTATPVQINDEESGDEVFPEVQLKPSDLLIGVVDYASSSDAGSPRHIVDDSVSSPTRSLNGVNGFHRSPTLMYGTKGPISMDIEDSEDLYADTAALPFAEVTLPPPLNGHATNGFTDLHDTLPSENGTSPDVPGDESFAYVDVSLQIAQTSPAALNGKKKNLSVDIPQTLPEDALPFTPATPAVDMPEEGLDDDIEEDSSIPYYLRPYAVAPVEWDPQAKVKPPLLLRGTLRPYQQAGLEWLASIHARNLNGILADEMGLGKTIQTIALLAHLACDRGIWGPHLIIVPTSVLLNWEMEFKKFLPGFNVLSYHGNTKQRKELRQGWNNKYHFNVCITSYTLASRDAHVFKRKRWYYMILDEAHMIKNFKSQRWNILLMFRSFRRLLLTGTPLQNNLTELWALLQFLMSGTDFANLKEFGEWFANPLEKAIELGAVDDEVQQRVSKLHTVLRPYLLRRLKRDVEKELPQKYEHLVMCPLSKRQRFLYDEFMARADTRYDLQSGVYQKIANILMQLRKVVNHPDLFEVRPIVTSFAMQRSAIADFEIKELLVRRRLLVQSDEDRVNLDLLGLKFIDNLGQSEIAARETRRLDATAYLPMISEVPGEPPPVDTRTIAGWRKHRAYQQRAETIARWTHIAYLNRLRTSQVTIYSADTLTLARRFYQPLLPYDVPTRPTQYLTTPERVRSAIKSYTARAGEMSSIIDRFTFATPAVVARDLPSIALSSIPEGVVESVNTPEFDATLHRAAVKLQIAFPDPSLLQFDCGKLQMLANLLRERRAGGHRVLIFTQMTRILDILEIFLNLHGYLYLRLDGATKIEDRQYITERFNSDPRVFCFISSSRSGGVGINLTGADTVIFYDSDFNPQMDRQCEDRAHRIGQIRDVHIYRFISQHTVEEALLRKANQKRSLDDLVIQRGAFDWRTLLVTDDADALTRALGEFEDREDAEAAQIAAREERMLESEDAQDFEVDAGAGEGKKTPVERRASEPDLLGEVREAEAEVAVGEGNVVAGSEPAEAEEGEGEEEEEEGRTTVDYMLDFIRLDWEHFGGWSV